MFPLKAHLITARVRTVAITFTWFIAVFLNSVEFYMPVCAYKNTSTFYVNFARGRTTFLFTVPLIILAISYCGIAITLRKHDRALQCGHQSNQRKRQAIKMSFCVMLSFYFLILPLTIVANLLPDPKVFKSCSVLQNIYLVTCSVGALRVFNCQSHHLHCICSKLSSRPNRDHPMLLQQKSESGREKKEQPKGDKTRTVLNYSCIR